MSMDNASDEPRRQHRFDKHLENVKIVKEKDAEGNITGFSVHVEKKGYAEKKRFKTIRDVYSFLKDIEKEPEKVFDRKFRRINATNLIYYICLDKQGRQFTHGMGRTLNISQGGILLETHSPVDTRDSILISIDTEAGLVMDIKGRIVYCRQAGEGLFHSGIQFVETNETAKAIVNKHIQKLKEQIEKLDNDDTTK